ncbi:MAG TPA: AcvB/VirJ family lysyl-phosphatidylglycerol hydrolase, partial [Caulobacteraceae bacterium]|nr:AcvB/VirJ family lysyl-phosphatidylglycerol hydrolase [Caulobacteraceae bacterium]
PLLVTNSAVQKGSDTFVVLYSGDGGWAKADCEFSRGFAARGMPVLGVNSVRYFGKRRTPQGAAADLSRWIEAYSARWDRPKVILMGYSFGASALPIIAENLPAQTRARVQEVALAGPGSNAELVLRPRTWFNHLAPDATPIAPAVAQIRDLHVLCVYGAQDRHAACPAFTGDQVRVKTVPGTHRFRGAYDQVVGAVTG